MARAGDAVITRRLYSADRVVVGDGSVLEYGAVAVEGSRIVGVGAIGDVGRDPASHRHFPSASLIPGLVDCHVHLAFDGGADPRTRLVHDSGPRTILAMAANARRLLAAGVTTARDLGAPAFLDIVLRKAIDDDDAAGPRLLLATRPLTTTGGHCWFLGVECDSADEIVRAVRENRREGADLVKLMVTGGAMTPHSRPWATQFGPEEVLAAVDEAHRHGQPVAAHVHGADGIEVAVGCGVDSLEHCTWQAPDRSDGYRPRVADAIAASGAWVCGTFNPRLAAMPTWFERRRAVVQDMRDRGIRFIAGSDAGAELTRHCDYARALSTMADYGFTPAEVLAAAGLDAARALGVDAETGSLMPGKAADLVAVPGDPLADLACLASPLLTVARGLEVWPGKDRDAAAQQSAPESALAALDLAASASR